MRRAALHAVFVALGASVALVALPSVAAAQAPGAHRPPPAPIRVVPAYAPPQARRGLVLGVGLGVGSINPVDEYGDTVEEYEGVSFDLHIGGMLSPRFALLGEVWTVEHHSDENDGDGQFTLAHDIAVIAAQYWLTQRFWIKGGIGRASYTIEDDFGAYDSEAAPAVMGGLGYELSHSHSFAIDVQLRLGVADYEEGELQTGAFTVGFNWY